MPKLFVERVWQVAPGVLLFGHEAADTDHSWAPLADQEPAMIDLPDETYVREFARLGMDDPAAAIDFCVRFGPVGVPSYSDLPSGMGPHPFKNRPPLPHPWSLAEDVVHAAAALDKAGVPPDRLPAYATRVQRVSLVATYAGVMHDLVGLWGFLNGSVTLEEVDAEWQTPSWALVRPSKWGKSISEGPLRYQMAAARLAEGLNPALRPFHVRLETSDHYWHGEPVNVYSLMCLQLANHIAEQAPYKRCVACGQLFVRKQDRRYRMGQRRLSGGRFCSDTCEDRWHQAEHRRRKREKANQAKEGK